jgi:two-component sensor histidine kinase
MKEPNQVPNAIYKPTPHPARPERRRAAAFLGMVIWTAFVILALWWLLRAASQEPGGASWVVHDGDSPHKALLDRARDWFRLAHLNFQRIYPWILFGPYVAWLALHFALERGRLRLNLPIHLAACAAFVAASHAINVRTAVTVADVVVIRSHQQSDWSPAGREFQAIEVKVSAGPADGPLPEQLAERLFQGNLTNHGPNNAIVRERGELSGAHLTNLITELEQAIKPRRTPPGPMTLRPLSTLLDLLAYGAMVGLAHSVHFYRRYRDREHRALFLESNLAKARLNALQAQLQPHFLFNTLNAIATLLRRDPKAAETTLVSLSELLRLALSQSDKQEITLREELHFLERYLEIQQTRFGDRLRLEQDIPLAALDCLVPTLLLQPLVENAIRHGIEPSENGGLVRVRARDQDGRLALSVEDDGVGFAPGAGAASETGIGLANLRARLEALYGASQKLELTERSEGGVAVRIEIPWRPVTLGQTAEVSPAV